MAQKGKSRGTDAKMSTSKGQDRGRGRVNKDKSTKTRWIQASPLVLTLRPQFIRQQTFNTSMTALDLL